MAKPHRLRGARRPDLDQGSARSPEYNPRKPESSPIYVSKPGCIFRDRCRLSCPSLSQICREYAEDLARNHALPTTSKNVKLTTQTLRASSKPQDDQLQNSAAATLPPQVLLNESKNLFFWIKLGGAFKLGGASLVVPC